MDKYNYSDMEKRFADRESGLGDLYDGDALDSGEEDPSPILDSLRRETGHYVDETFVCAGGEKRIFRVHDLQTDRRVALARPLESASEVGKEQFLREARLTACLQHPNILSAYDVGIDEKGEPFFTMEFVPGDSLKKIIDKIEEGNPDYLRRFPLSRLLELFVKICDGLAYAHSRGVIHLDIKPGNITVGPFGEALLCDWGLARVIPQDRQILSAAVSSEELPDADILNDQTLRGVVKGTPGFMAPEQAGMGGEITAQTDIYSLGALLYFMLTLRLPVQGNSANELLEKTVEGNVITPSAATPERLIPAGLEAVVMKALSVDPAQRYESVAAFSDELHRYLTGYATEAQSAGVLVQLKLLIRRRPMAFNILVSSIVLLAIVVSSAFVRVLSEKREAEENFRLYRAETEHSRVLSDSILATASGIMNTEDFLHAPAKIRALTQHLSRETDPDRVLELKEYLAILHFILQDFNQSANYFSQIEVKRRFERCNSIAAEYARIKPNDSGWLSPEQLRHLLAFMPRSVENIAFHLAYYHFTNAPKVSPDQMWPVAEVLLDKLNNRSYTEVRNTELKMEQREAGWHLSLSGKPYSVFQMPIPLRPWKSNVLASLNLHSLDLSYSGFTDLENLTGVLVEELNIAGMKHLPEYKCYILERCRVKRVFHTLDDSDAYLKSVAPGVEFIRLEK